MKATGAARDSPRSVVNRRPIPSPLRNSFLDFSSNQVEELPREFPVWNILQGFEIEENARQLEMESLVSAGIFFWQIERRTQRFEIVERKWQRMREKFLFIFFERRMQGFETEGGKWQTRRERTRWNHCMYVDYQFGMFLGILDDEERVKKWMEPKKKSEEY